MDLQLLLTGLESDDEDERAFAAEDLCEAGGSVAVDRLASRLEREPTRRVREAIVNTLAQLSDEATCWRVAAFLHADDPFLRASAITVLQRGRTAAIPAIEEALHAPSAGVRKLALDALAGIDAPDASKLLGRALEDEDVNVRIAAAEYVGERRNHEHKAAMERIFVAASDPMLHSAAFAALLAVGDASSWRHVVERHPTLALVPTHDRGSWLLAAGMWAPANSIELFAHAPGLAAHAFEDLVEALQLYCRRHALRSLPRRLFLELVELLRGASSPMAGYHMLRFVGSLHDLDGAETFLRAELDSADEMSRRGASAGLMRFLHRDSPELSPLVALAEAQTGAESSRLGQAGGDDRKDRMS